MSDKEKEIQEQAKIIQDLDEPQFQIAMKRINAILGMVRGDKDWKTKLSPLLEPEGISVETTARLTAQEAHAHGEMLALAEMYPFFEAFRPIVKHKNLSSISVGGMGRDDAIRLMGAMSGNEALRNLGLNLSPGGSYTTDKERKKAEKRGFLK